MLGRHWGTRAGSPSAILGKAWGAWGLGKKARAGRFDLGALLDVVLLLAIAIACLFTLPCLALPYLAMLFLSFLFSLSFSFSSSSIPLADGWKDDQVLSMIFATCKLAFGAPPTIVRESVCLLRGFSLSRKKKPLLPALRPGIEQHSFVWPLLSAPTGKENVEFSLDSSRGRGERGVEGARALASCVVAPHRWEHSRLGACHASLSSTSLVPQQRLDVAKCHHPRQPAVCVPRHPGAPRGLFCLRSPCRYCLLLLPVTMLTPIICICASGVT